MQRKIKQIKIRRSVDRYDDARPGISGVSVRYNRARGQGHAERSQRSPSVEPETAETDDCLSLCDTADSDSEEELSQNTRPSSRANVGRKGKQSMEEGEIENASERDLEIQAVATGA